MTIIDTMSDERKQIEDNTLPRHPPKRREALYRLFKKWVIELGVHTPTENNNKIDKTDQKPKKKRKADKHEQKIKKEIRNKYELLNELNDNDEEITKDNTKEHTDATNRPPEYILP